MYGYDNIDYTSGEQDNTLQFEENPCSIGRSHYTPTSERSAKDITKTAGYKEAMSDKNKGRISGPFETSDELFAHLDI